ncbi:MAG: DEAD/DEAH box helicase [Vicinamibacterales bacterium]
MFLPGARGGIVIALTGCVSDPSPVVPRTGTRVVARGEDWSVLSVTQHADCASIRLSRVSSGSLARARTLLLPFDRITPRSAPVTPRILTRRRWAAAVLDAVAGSRPFGALAAAANARIDLLPFQLEPALAMLRHGYTRLLVADEVGLGKTIQAGLILGELSRRDDALRALVLTPAGLREQWRMELADRFSLDAVTADAAWLTTRTRDLPPDINPWALPGIYLASLDLVKRPEVLRGIEDVTWDLFVLDEAHTAGLATARLAAASAVGQRSRRVLLLTATPPDGDPTQLAALGRIGRLDDDDALVEFRRTRDDAGFTNGRRTVLLQIRPSAAERRMHRRLDRYTRMVWNEAGARKDARGRLASAVLLKRALSSAWSLAASVTRRAALLDRARPAPSESQLLLPLRPLGDEDPIDDDVGDLILGAAGLADAVTERALLHQIEAAARAASGHESKLAFLIRLLRRAGEPVIVFTEYRDTLLHLERALRSAGFDPLLLHGGMPPRERTAVQRRFNELDSLLLATDAASEGLNLHLRCRMVVHFELPWTPARLEQRTGRVDRLGQKRKVHEVLLVARHTAERMVLAPLVKRARATRQRTRHGRGATTVLTESRVMHLIMNTTPPAREEASAPATAATAHLRDEAVREAERILFQRRFAEDQEAGARPLICSGAPGRRRCRAAHLLTLVYRVALEDLQGALIHSVIVPLGCAGHLPATRGADDLRALLARFEREDGARSRTVAATAAQEELRRAILQHAALGRSLQRRERWLAEHLPSVAQQLVQAGLFDGRAMRYSEARRRTATLLTDEIEQRSSRIGAVELTTRVTLVAVRLGRRGGG